MPCPLCFGLAAEGVPCALPCTLPPPAHFPTALSEMFASTLTIGVSNGGNKRKAASASGSVASSRQGHFGLSNDSSASLALVALSRVGRVRDDEILQPAAQTPVGTTLIAYLKAVVLRVAQSAVGGAQPPFGELSVASLFNLSASAIATQRLYDGGLSLPSTLPWARAKALVNALLEGVSAVRGTSLGARVGTALLSVPAAPLDAATQADLAALVAAVEEETTARLSGASGSGGGGGGGASGSGSGSAAAESSAGGGGGGGASSSRSSRSSPPLPPLPLPLPSGSDAGGDDNPTVAAVPIPDAIEPMLTLSANARRLLEARLMRPLVDSEALRLEEALGEALSVLQAGGADARQQLLSSTDLATALLNPGASMLWACVTEAATEGDASSAVAFGTTLVAAASTIAGALFASTFGM